MSESPVTARQFISFEWMLGIAGVIIVVLGAFAWKSHENTFEKHNEQFEKHTQQFEKVVSKLDQLIITTTQIKTQMDSLTKAYDKTSEQTLENKHTLARLDERIKHLNNKAP